MARTTRTSPPTRIRRALRVLGVVQGVGFRPFVYRLACEHSLGGFVRNDDLGVLLEIEGEAADVARFEHALEATPPPSARITEIHRADLTVQHSPSFRIDASGARGNGTVPVSPDLATCADCWREFHDRTDRRYQYPFINCTQCGPRYTIVRDVPYDRPQTTMAAFTMCPACQAEYDDPVSRRFHAQPNACAVCGPRLEFRLGGDDLHAQVAPQSFAVDAIVEAQALLARGGVLAVKGVGGYHLMCDARSDAAVATLRARKRRLAKPLAVMAADVQAVRQFAEVSSAAAQVLSSPARPIVLLPMSPDAPMPLAARVAPGVDAIGVMLPYVPVHAMLLAHGPLVCTSGNVSDEPLAFDDVDALVRLAPLADGFLLHNRPIHVPCDDSVVQVDERGEWPVRRSRGFAPLPIPLRVPANAPAVLAVGAELKSTIAVTRDTSAFLSAHLGDVASPVTLDALSQTTAHMLALHRVVPTRVACDLHPGYLSARWAREYAAARQIAVVPVQHHHAHLASLMAEHALDGAQKLLAFTFDGTGYGPDGTVWGGEALCGDYRGFERIASLVPFALPGGDRAVRSPGRTALAALHAAGIPWEHAPVLVGTCSAVEQRVLHTQLERGLRCATTSSMGRLFDVCAALTGVCLEASYEGQAAMELEALAHRASPAQRTTRYSLALRPTHAVPNETAPALLMDWVPLLTALLDDRRAGVAVESIAYAVHLAVADAVHGVAQWHREQHGEHDVGLTGGVFQNALLRTLSIAALSRGGFRVFTHHRVPCNDGGLALGQALVATFHTDTSS